MVTTFNHFEEKIEAYGYWQAVLEAWRNKKTVEVSELFSSDNKLVSIFADIASLEGYCEFHFEYIGQFLDLRDCFYDDLELDYDSIGVVLDAAIEQGTLFEDIREKELRQSGEIQDYDCGAPLMTSIPLYVGNSLETLKILSDFWRDFDVPHIQRRAHVEMLKRARTDFKKGPREP